MGLFDAILGRTVVRIECREPHGVARLSVRGPLPVRDREDFLAFLQGLPVRSARLVFRRVPPRSGGAQLLLVSARGLDPGLVQRVRNYLHNLG